MMGKSRNSSTQVIRGVIKSHTKVFPSTSNWACKTTDLIKAASKPSNKKRMDERSQKDQE